MHNAALAAAGLDDWRYLALPLPPELFAETVRALPAAGFRGVNVTIPHKEAALALADRASAAAREIGAANTLTFEQGGAISADNTDAPGLLEALAAAGCDPRGRTALVLGAGGAARAAVWALVRAGAAASRSGTGRRNAPRRSPPTSAPAPYSGPRRPRSSSTARPSASPTRTPRSRHYPCRPIAWVPEAAWWTWSTGTAGRGSSKRQEHEERT